MPHVVCSKIKKKKGKRFQMYWHSGCSSHGGREDAAILHLGYNLL